MLKAVNTSCAKKVRAREQDSPKHYLSLDARRLLYLSKTSEVIHPSWSDRLKALLSDVFVSCFGLRLDNRIDDIQYISLKNREIITKTHRQIQVSVNSILNLKVYIPKQNFYPFLKKTFRRYIQVRKIERMIAKRKEKKPSIIRAFGRDREVFFALLPRETTLFFNPTSWCGSTKRVKLAAFIDIKDSAIAGCPDTKIFAVKIEKFKIKHCLVNKKLRVVGNKARTELYYNNLICPPAFYSLRLEYELSDDRYTLTTYLFSPYHKSDHTTLEPFTRYLFFFSKICQELSRIHNLGVIHGDIKPDNFILSKESGVNFIDFEMSSLINHPIKAVTGTPGYIAPEVVKYKLRSRGSDIYSLAVSIEEILLTKFLIQEKLGNYHLNIYLKGVSENNSHVFIFFQNKNRHEFYLVPVGPPHKEFLIFYKNLSWSILYQNIGEKLLMFSPRQYHSICWNMMVALLMRDYCSNIQHLSPYMRPKAEEMENFFRFFTFESFTTYPDEASYAQALKFIRHSLKIFRDSNLGRFPETLQMIVLCITDRKDQFFLDILNNHVEADKKALCISFLQSRVFLGHDDKKILQAATYLDIMVGYFQEKRIKVDFGCEPIKNFQLILYFYCLKIHLKAVCTFGTNANFITLYCNRVRSVIFEEIKSLMGKENLSPYNHSKAEQPPLTRSMSLPITFVQKRDSVQQCIAYLNSNKTKVN